jgi:ubiquitin C-terminal hydrolase
MFLIDSFHMAMSRAVTMNVTGNAKNPQDTMGQQCYEMMKTMYTRDYSEMLNIFYGIQMSIITSTTTGEILSLKPEPYFIINLPIPLMAGEESSKTPAKLPTLFDCFREHCVPETLQGENAWYNESAGVKQDVHKRISFWNLPNVLVIDLKRFVYTDRGVMRKIQVPVEIPINNVDMSEFVQGYNKTSYVYDLFGICNHHGGMNGGHYTATVRNANGLWYAFNDTLVKPVDIKEEVIISNAPYCLFYRKKKINASI